MWQIPPEALASGDHREVQAITSAQVEDPARFLARIAEINASSAPESFDILELKDGRTIERFSIMQAVEGAAAGRVWSFSDITERKRSEQELRDQAEWFRVTLASIGDAVVTVDTESRISFLNDAAVELTGWPLEAAIGRPMDEVLPLIQESTREPMDSPIHRALAEGTHRRA
jgi:PAS domain-containing protein